MRLQRRRGCPQRRPRRQPRRDFRAGPIAIPHATCPQRRPRLQARRDPRCTRWTRPASGSLNEGRGFNLGETCSRYGSYRYHPCPQRRPRRQPRRDFRAGPIAIPHATCPQRRPRLQPRRDADNFGRTASDYHPQRRPRLQPRRDQGGAFHALGFRVPSTKAEASTSARPTRP